MKKPFRKKPPHPPKTEAGAGRTALLVVGMHRSGTSAVTRVLSLLGADLASQLLPPTADNNPTGFWEPVELVHLSDQLLDGLDLNWLSVQQFKENWLFSPQARHFKIAFAAFLEREFPTSPRFILKDPRLCRILPLVVSVLRDAGIQPKVVFCLRSPYEVAASLHGLQKIAPSKGCAVWLRYVLDAELHSRELPRVMVPYDLFLADWRDAVVRIGRELDIDWSEALEAASGKIDDFLQPGLRHYAIHDETTWLPWVNDAYEQLRQLTEDPYHKPSLKRLDAIRAAVAEHDHFLLDMAFHDCRWAMEERNAKMRLEEEVRDQEARLAHMRAALDDLTASGQAAREEVAARDAALAKAADDARSCRAALAGREQELTARDAALAEADADAQACRAVLAGREQDLAGLREELAAREIALAQADADVQACHATLADREQDLAGLRRAVGRLESRLEAAGGLIRAEAEREAGLRETLASLSRRNQELEAQRDAALEHVRSQERRGPAEAVIESLERLRREKTVVHELALRTMLGLTLLMPPGELPPAQRALMALVGGSGLFDPRHYAAIFQALHLPQPTDPLHHFVRFGLSLGLDPSPLFDSAYYCAGNGDVDFRNTPPFLHFLLYGAFEGKNPNPLFDVACYLDDNPDVSQVENPLLQEVLALCGDGELARRYNPLVHYVRFGEAEGRRPSAYFDVAFYRQTQGVALQDGQTALAHFLGRGWRENRQPNLLFDVAYYLSRHPEVRACGVNPVEHYIAIGASHGYKPHPYFDTRFYLDSYEDVRALGLNPLAHFLTNGRREQRMPNPLFDPRFYLAAHPDLDPGTVDPLEHYITIGASQRRRPHPDFSPRFYWENHSDLVLHGCDPLGHFLDHGAFEGRRPNDWFDADRHCRSLDGLDRFQEAPFLHFLRCGGPGRPQPEDRADAPLEGRIEDLPWRYAGEPRSPRGICFRILFVTHVANRTGAPLCILRLLEELVHAPGVECRIVIHEDGELTPHLARLAPALVMSDLDGEDAASAMDRVARLFRQDATRCLAVTNTVATAAYAEAFWKQGVPVLAWLHELPTSIETYARGASTMERIDLAARRILCPSDFVKQALVSRYALTPDKVSVLHNGTEQPPADLDRQAMRRRVREEFGLPEQARIVLGCGTVDLRKGADLFVRLACALGLDDPELAADTWFLWVGDPYDEQMRQWLEHDALRLGVAGRFILAGPRADVGPYFAAADAFALTSREDPFPMVNMEALSYGLPVAAFDGAGGAREVLEEPWGVLVPYGDTTAMAQAVAAFLADSRQRREDRQAAAMAFIATRTWRRYAEAFTAMLRDFFDYRPPLGLRVSVVIPNYNYADYLPRRIASVLAQTRLPDEIVFVDNRSTDDSVAIARHYARTSPVPFRVVVNDANNGCTFKQWLRGLSLVSGDLVWIAESDDWCEPEFLERLVPEFYDERVRLAYAQSAVAGPEDQIYAADYRHYTDDISPTHWNSWYCLPGEQEVALALSQKNTIPNASAVVFRRPELAEVTPSLLQYRLCGDWWFYTFAIRHGHIAFVPQVLNYHRRHAKTVTCNIEKQDRAMLEALAVKNELFTVFPLSANTMCRSLACSAYEYDCLTRQHDLKRRSLTENPDFAAILEALQARIHPKGDDGRLRILTVLPDLEIGGGQTAGIRLANAFAQGHASFLLNARPARHDPAMAELVDDAVICLEGTLDMTPWAARHYLEHNPNQLAENDVRLQLLRELLVFHKIDVVISHVWWADRLAFAMTRDLGLPWFIRMHGCYEGLVENPDWDAAFPDLVRPMLQAATGVFYSTKRNLKVFDWARLPAPELTAQLFNGFDASQVPRTPGNSLERGENDFVFCLCSRAIPEKGWEEAIEAVQRINGLPAARRGGKRARLALIGGGAYADELAARFADEDAVAFLGSRSQVAELMAQCDVGLLPSRFLSESLPSSLIEYFACGIPAIATDVGSILDMVSADGREAALILPLHGRLTFSSADLSALMLRYMLEPDLYAAHKHNARYVFDKKFNINAIAESYLDSITQALARHPLDTRSRWILP